MKKIFSIFSSIILVCSFSCKEKTTKQKNYAHDLCKEICAIDKNKEYNYDTKKGEANFTIPFPKGATLKEVSTKNNVITYNVSKGGDFKTPDSKTIKKSKLLRGNGQKLTIIVEFEDFKCKENNITKRKKTTVIQGSPLHLECKIIE